MKESSSSPPPLSGDPPKAGAALSTPPPDSPTKRKRAHSNRTLDLRVETAVHADLLDESASGCDSPRTKVADKFKDLELQRSKSPLGLQSHDEDGGRSRKRMKRNESLDSPAPSPTVVVEIGETPDCYAKGSIVQRPSPPSSSPMQQTSFTAVRVLVSPPPQPASKPLPSSGSTKPDDGSLSPLPCSGDLTPDQAALTWQDDEITGHQLDLGGDDDGEGINGIGFRPTPAIAYARSQRRKQQVSEWKAREGREARQRRIEKRRGLSIGSGGKGTEGRSVRFIDGGLV